MGFLNELFHPRPKAKAKPAAKKPETSREAADAALRAIFSAARNPRK